MTSAELATLILTGQEIPPGDIAIALQRYDSGGFAPHFRAAAVESGVPQSLLEGIAWRESGFRSGVKNPDSGAAGLMQIIPANWPKYGLSLNPYDPRLNISAGARILRDAWRKEGGITRGLAAYSGHTTWLRTGGNPKPDDYIRGSWPVLSTCGRAIICEAGAMDVVQITAIEWVNSIVNVLTLVGIIGLAYRAGSITRTVEQLERDVGGLLDRERRRPHHGKVNKE